MADRPKIVCLCGSTRFMDAFFEEGWRQTLEGRIVLSVGVCKYAEADEEGGHGAEMLGPEVVARLDELHLRKIDLADFVMVLNVGGYVGPSTAREVLYAFRAMKPVLWLEPDNRPAADKLMELAEKAPPLEEVANGYSPPGEENRNA